MIGSLCILTLLLAGRIAAPSREKIRPWTDYSAPPIRTAVDVDLTSSSDPDAIQSDGDILLGPRTPERLQAPAPLSRSHSVSPKRTSLNRKDREKTDTGNIGISARSCDARRSKADPFSLRIAKRLARNEEGTVSVIHLKTILPGELTPEAVKPALQSGHPRTHANWGEMKLAASLAWWDPLICQPVEGEHNTVQATRTREGGPVRRPGQAHGNHFTGRVGFPQKIDLGLGQWKWRAPKSAGQGYGKATRQ
ncbi:hypothetical protein BO85DRAFT_470367 [Aspergillus piperis CBS 112811]|uniref:Uncharacterized protein n=1 Tax=Aspergillus piperis CBS 112811 TaxID=1448313 RepID=A0A8G1QXT4_9EURO|nr:hypothetical protein BO85DRAFT_470367 [Aspergillus piperis CBS 112811]RAH55532.1 hypothetical protein BO85DRAFT_470367 [Aspergillus piperis CBS 112811]